MGWGSPRAHGVTRCSRPCVYKRGRCSPQAPRSDPLWLGGRPRGTCREHPTCLAGPCAHCPGHRPRETAGDMPGTSHLFGRALRPLPRSPTTGARGGHAGNIPPVWPGPAPTAPVTDHGRPRGTCRGHPTCLAGPCAHCPGHRPRETAGDMPGTSHLFGRALRPLPRSPTTGDRGGHAGNIPPVWPGPAPTAPVTDHGRPRGTCREHPTCLAGPCAHCPGHRPRETAGDMPGTSHLFGRALRPLPRSPTTGDRGGHAGDIPPVWPGPAPTAPVTDNGRPQGTSHLFGRALRPLPPVPDHGETPPVFGRALRPLPRSPTTGTPPPRVWPGPAPTGPVTHHGETTPPLCLAGSCAHCPRSPTTGRPPPPVFGRALRPLPPVTHHGETTPPLCLAGSCAHCPRSPTTGRPPPVFGRALRPLPRSPTTGTPPPRVWPGPAPTGPVTHHGETTPLLCLAGPCAHCPGHRPRETPPPVFGRALRPLAPVTDHGETPPPVFGRALRPLPRSPTTGRPPHPVFGRALRPLPPVTDHGETPPPVFGRALRPLPPVTDHGETGRRPGGASDI